MRACYIFGAGEVYSAPTIPSDSLVIAADGGLAHLYKIGVKPDVLIGDFDSLDLSEICGDKKCGFEDCEALRDFLSDSEILRYPIEKDDTDMRLSYKIGVSRGCDEFHIYGGSGGREDHTFANYCLLLEAKNDRKRAFLYNQSGRVFIVKNEKISIRGKSGKTVSVFAFGSDAEGVSIKGLKYEAMNVNLPAQSSLCVSNSYTESGFGEISVKNGALIVLEEK